MAKYYGLIGYGVTEETSPGVWQKSVITKAYAGDIIRNSRRWQTRDKVNDELNISNTISIIADPYASQNFHSIIFAEWMGTRWKVTDVEVEYPRLKLTLGGVYNGEQA